MGSIKIPEETLKWFGGDELRARVFYEKYALRDYNGNIVERIPPEMWKRVAREIASVEKDEKKEEWEKKFYWILENFRFVPGGRIMFGAGNPRKSTLLNCYYLPIKEDSIEGIFECAKEMARTYSYGGGVGIDITILRPKGSPVNNSAIYSTGAVSFMDLFSKVTGTIGQCLAKGTKVLTKEGLKNIEEIKIGDLVWTDKGWQRVTFVFEPRKTKLYKLRTKYGFQIIASADHKFLDIDFKLKPLKDFKKGDKVIMIRGKGLSNTDYVKLKKVEYTRSEYNNSNRLNEIKQPEILNEELAYWLGFLIGDGSVYMRKNRKSTEFSFSISKKYPQIMDRVIYLSEKLFGLKLYIRDMDGKQGYYWKFGTISKYLHKFLKENGILKNKSFDAYVFDKIFSSPKSVISSFLAGLFDADGYIGVSNGRIRKGYTYNTVSEELARGIQILLLSLGIVSKIRIEKREHKGWRNLYELTITGKSSCRIFVGEVGKYSLRLKDEIVSKRDNVLTPFTAEKLGISYAGITGYGTQLISVSQLERAISYYSLDIDNVLFVDEIEEIEFKGEDLAYDIEVENTHKFFANGFYVSNSGRRGALMITIEDRHPDIFDFIDVKDDPLRMNVRYANISVKISDKFMHTLKEDGNFTLWFENERVKRIELKVRAREIWDRLVKRAWSSAEPGVIFWDTAKRFSPTEYDEKMAVKGVNPCSEQVLEDYGCCNLGNINLSLFVKNAFGKKPLVEKFWELVEKKGVRYASEYAEKMGWAYPDLENLEKAVRIGMRFLDDVLDYSAGRHPLTQQREASLYTRRTGLGATGLADMLAKMRIKYDTDSAIYMMDKLFEFIKNTAYDESSEIAKEKGSFPGFQREKHLDQPFLKGVREDIREKIWSQGLRNSCLLTIPPVGSGAVLAGTTGGIEPIFALSYIRRSESLSKETFKVYHPLVGVYLEMFGGENENDLPDFFITAHQIDPIMRVKIQGTIQKHIDSSISSTVNLPKHTTPDEIGKIYELAWEMGCKGITVYREGSREGVLITEEEAKGRIKEKENGERITISDICPECSSRLKRTNSHAVCRGCGLTFSSH